MPDPPPRCYDSGVPAFARRLALLCALLPQVGLALRAPAFLVCQERSGALAVEWSPAVCCDGDAGRADDGAEPELRAGDACAGCTDRPLERSLQREEGAAGPTLLLAVAWPPAPAASWTPAPRRTAPARAPPRLGEGAVRLACLRAVVIRS